jgi:hypothetical protein
VASLGLTRREAEVLVLLAEGRTNRQTGQALFITERRPASMSPTSSPSSAWLGAGRRRQWPTGSASTSNERGYWSRHSSGPRHGLSRAAEPSPKPACMAVQPAGSVLAREVMRSITAVR